MKVYKNKLIRSSGEHICFHCGKEIHRGNICKVIDMGGIGRHWLCIECNKLYDICIDICKWYSNAKVWNRSDIEYNRRQVLDVYREWGGRRNGVKTYLDDDIDKLVSETLKTKGRLIV